MPAWYSLSLSGLLTRSSRLRSSHASKVTGFCGEWYLETNIWALDKLAVPGVSLLLGPRSGQTADMCSLHVCGHTHPPASY